MLLIYSIYDIMGSMKLAFVGPAAVGKDAVSEHIAKKFGLTPISSGDIVREYVTKNNLGTLDRSNVRIIAKKMRDEGGGDILVKIALKKTPDNIVLTGLRTVDEIYTFKKMDGKVISINAPMERRYEWAKLRGRIGDNISFEDFKRIENEEYSDKDRNSQNVGPVMALADLEVTNEGTLEELFKKCEAIIGSLKSSS